MAAWYHSDTLGWNDERYREYRDYVRRKAPDFRGRHEDCADLSIMLLIAYAAENQLTVTFKDSHGTLYISKAEGAINNYGGRGGPTLDEDLRWRYMEDFTRIVQRRIDVAALWERNTVKNPASYAPEPGDLMIIFGSQGMFTSRHHACLVYERYPAGARHWKAGDTSVPDFPGHDEALKQVYQTEYFRGTMNDDGKTTGREPDYDSHFDYLNSRADAKRNAELIYFANARQILKEGFEFRMYGPSVLDDWREWSGKDTPPSTMIRGLVQVARKETNSW